MPTHNSSWISKHNVFSTLCDLEIAMCKCEQWKGSSSFSSWDQPTREYNNHHLPCYCIYLQNKTHNMLCHFSITAKNPEDTALRHKKGKSSRPQTHRLNFQKPHWNDTIITGTWIGQNKLARHLTSIQAPTFIPQNEYSARSTEHITCLAMCIFRMSSIADTSAKRHYYMTQNHQQSMLQTLTTQ